MTARCRRRTARAGDLEAGASTVAETTATASGAQWSSVGITAAATDPHPPLCASTNRVATGIRSH